jgi:hypothetical protein
MEAALLGERDMAVEIVVMGFNPVNSSSQEMQSTATVRLLSDYAEVVKIDTEISISFRSLGGADNAANAALEKLATFVDTLKASVDRLRRP